jgi:hypothetical protein
VAVTAKIYSQAKLSRSDSLSAVSGAMPGADVAVGVGGTVVAGRTVGLAGGVSV